MVAQRTTAKEKPAKFAVEAAEAALHFERLYRIQRFPECFQNSWQVVWMNRNLPSRTQSLLCRWTRIVQPALIDEVRGAVWSSGPCQSRNGVDDKANVLFISRFFEAMPQGFHARIIEPYGGQIGPKLGSSCTPGDDAQALQVVAVRHLIPRSQGEMVPGALSLTYISDFNGATQHGVGP